MLSFNIPSVVLVALIIPYNSQKKLKASSQSQIYIIQTQEIGEKAENVNLLDKVV